MEMFMFEYVYVNRYSKYNFIISVSSFWHIHVDNKNAQCFPIFTYVVSLLVVIIVDCCCDHVIFMNI